MESKDTPSILLSTFKRTGAEGEYTNIINQQNIYKFSSAISALNENEKALIIFLKDEYNWTLLTDYALLSNVGGDLVRILHSDIIEVVPAMQEEFKDGIRDLKQFTRLNVKDRKRKKHIIVLEKGKPYNGFLQVLHFLSTRNN